MKVILRKDVAKVGKRDTAVEVADGYALNFLIARGLAVQATPAALATLKEKQQVAAQSAAATDAQAKAIVSKLDGAHVHVVARVNDKGHLYRQLSKEEIAAAIAKEHGVIVPAGAITTKEAVKAAGEWGISIVLSGHQASCVVAVAPQA